MVEAIYFAPRGKSHIFASGPKRAGKSFAQTRPVIDLWASTYRNCDFGLATFSEGRREAILQEVQGVCSELGVGFSRGKRHVRFGDGNCIWYFTGNHSESHRAIEGFTWRGCFVDEASRLHPKSLREVSARCTPVGEPAGPVVIAYSCNPGSPSDEIKLGLMQDIEDGKRRGHVFYFSVEDNPALSEDELEELKLSFPEGPARDRDFYGLWVEVSGAVHPNLDSFIRNPPIKEQPMRCSVTTDPTTSGTWHAWLVGHYSRNRHWALAEWRHDCRLKGVIPREEAARRVVELGQSAPAFVERWVTDAADPAFGALVEAEAQALGESGSHHYQYAKPDILASVRAMNTAFALKRLHLSPECGEGIAELRNLRWAEKRYEAAADELIDPNLPRHGHDALRYLVWESPDMWLTEADYR